MFTTRLRSVQFSVTSILLLMTLVSVYLVFTVLPEQRRRRAEAILLTVGKITDSSDGSGHLELSGLWQSKESERVTEVSSGRRQLQGISIDDLRRDSSTISALATATGLLEIEINTSDLEFADLSKVVSSLPGLLHLRLKECRVKLQPTLRLSSRSLESLEFIDCKFEGTSPTKPFRLGNLREVGFGETKLSPEFLDCFLSCNRLEAISLSKTAIGDAAIDSLSRMCRLKRIRIDGAKLSKYGKTHLKLVQPSAELVDDDS